MTFKEVHEKDQSMTCSRKADMTFPKKEEMD